MALAALIAASPAISQEKKPAAPPPARVKVIKVWASDQPENDEKSQKAARDELKAYRKSLEKETGKKNFSIEGKVDVQDAIPGRVLQYQLHGECNLEVTPMLEGKGDQERLILQVSLRKGKEEKRVYKVGGDLPLIYCTPLPKEGERKFVLIVHKLPPQLKVKS